MFVNNEEMKSPVGAVSTAMVGLERIAAKAAPTALVAVAALLLAPNAALAQSECGLQTDPGNPETVTCAPGDYNDGITYDSLGDLTLEIEPGSVDLNVFDDGINVTGNGADNLFFDASAYELQSGGGNSIRGTSGAVIDYLSDTGNISIVTQPASTNGRVNGSGSATHGIRAQSLGGGDIDITAYRLSFLADGGSAIEAVTAGGDITINSVPSVIGTIVCCGGQTFITLDRSSFSSPISAQTEGVGSIVMNLQGTGADLREGSSVSGSGAGTAAIHAVAESGDITINSYVVTNESTGVGILTDTAGTATINATGPIDAETAIRALGNNVVVNFAGDPTEDIDSDDFGSAGNKRAMNRGGFDFSALTGSAEMNFGANSTWMLDPDFPTMVFSGGDDTVTIGAEAIVTTEPLFGSTSGSASLETVVVEFGAGEDALNNSGTLMAGTVFQNIGFLSSVRTRGSVLRFDGLETFENSGAVYLGPAFTGGNFVGTDLWYDDILEMQGVEWVGASGSRVVVDTLLNNIGQTACNDGQRDANFDLPAADCLDLRGGTATGRTEIRFINLIAGDRGAYNPDGNVIVDLSGGSADPGAFVIAPDTQNYNAELGAIDKGLFIYPLAYDPDTQQFKLYGLPGPGAQQLPLLAQAANELWRTTTDGWFERSVDQRHVEAEDGLGGGLWFRGARKEHDRDVATPIIAGGETLTFDNGYSQDDTTFTFGLDMVSRSAGNSAWVAGAMLGYARAEVDFDKSANRANFEGMHAGIYGSLTFGDFYIDAVLNRSWQDLDSEIPSLDLFPDTAELSTDMNSTGARIEAGWSGLSFGRLGIEPLAGLTYVKADFEDIEVPADDPNRFGANVQFDKAESLRGSLGVRLSVADVLPGIVPTEVSLTARAIEEFEGEAKALIENVGPIDAPVANTFDGTFAQVTGSVSVTNAAKTVAGYFNVDGTFESDYESVGIEAGFRYQW